MTKNNENIVYSSQYGRICPSCNKPVKKCICKKKKEIKADDGIVRIRRETKGRKGAGVTVITGIQKEETDLKKLAKKWKQKCGSGGTVKKGIIEIQGDHIDVLGEELKKDGFVVKGIKVRKNKNVKKET